MSDSEQFNQITKSRYGMMIYNKNDAYIGRSIEKYGEYSELETVIFDQFVQPGQLVVEVGANIGVHTLFFSRKVGTEGLVLAFEPQRIVYQTLCGNLAINSITNVFCWNTAVGAENGEIVVPALDYKQENNFGCIELETNIDGETVAVVTIDNLKLPKCDVIKIDVEGMEEAVIKGAAETIKQFKPVLYVGCDHADREESLIRTIDSLGYAMHWHRPALYNPNNLAENEENIFEDVVSQNLLCIDKAIDQQMTGFDTVEIPKAA